jgi:hypothetical protein
VFKFERFALPAIWQPVAHHSVASVRLREDRCRGFETLRRLSAESETTLHLPRSTGGSSARESAGCSSAALSAIGTVGTSADGTVVENSLVGSATPFMRATSASICEIAAASRDAAVDRSPGFIASLSLCAPIFPKCLHC